MIFLLLKRFFSHFWIRHPAFLYGLFLFFITSLSFGHFYCILAFVFLLTFLTKKQILNLLILSSLCLLGIKTFIHFPSQAESQGLGIVAIKEVKKAKRGWLYKGTLHSFVAEEGIAKNLPCTLYSKSRMSANATYEVEGLLKEIAPHYYCIKTKTPWNLAKNNFSLAEWRYQQKQASHTYLTTVMSQKKASTFLAGLSTGDLTDAVMKKEFERKGLSHLLAISGFHFAVLASAVQFLLRPFFKPKLVALLLMIAFTAYFIFIGNAPSVARAWIMAMFFLAGQILHRYSNALNNLGLALFFSLLFNPFVALHAGFQLSYLATCAILLLYKPIQHALYNLFPSQFFPLKWFKNSVCIVMAVYLAIFPLLLLHFHKLPLHGLLYNLFFPFLVTISIILLIISTLLHLCIPPLGAFLHHCNGFYTETILKLLELPLIPQKTLYVAHLSPLLITLYWLMLFVGSIFWHFKREEELESLRDEFRYF